MIERKTCDIHATGMALALTFGIISAVCFLLVFINIDFALLLFGSFMHGIDLSKTAVTPVLSWLTLLGFAVVIIGGYLIGVIFAALYNAFVRK